MRTLRALIDVFRKPDASQRELEDAAHEADLAATAAESEMAAAEAAYRAGLLGPEPALAKLDEARRAAALKRDRARALTDELDQRIIAAAAEANRERRQAMHDDAKAKCNAIGKRLAVEYPAAAAKIRTLLHDLAEAQVARGQAMEAALDLGFIPDPEAVVRGLNATPEEILDRREVDLWVVAGRAEPLAEERQADVQPQGGNRRRGYLSTPNSGHMYGGSGMLDCALRRFTRIAFREAVPAPDLESLIRAVNLPELRAYASPFALAERWREPSGAVSHFAGPAADAPPLQRAERIRFEPVPDPRANQEAA